MQAFRRKTDRGAERLCLRFPAKPPAATLATLKGHGAAYRRVGKDVPAAWFIPLEQAAPLVEALGDHPAAAALRPWLGAPAGAEEAGAQAGAAPAAAGAAPAVAAEVACGPAEDGGRRPKKRQRRSARLDAGPCVACQWQIAMLNATGRYHEPEIPHCEGCGF